MIYDVGLRLEYLQFLCYKSIHLIRDYVSRLLIEMFFWKKSNSNFNGTKNKFYIRIDILC